MIQENKEIYVDSYVIEFVYVISCEREEYDMNTTVMFLYIEDVRALFFARVEISTYIFMRKSSTQKLITDVNLYK